MNAVDKILIIQQQTQTRRIVWQQKYKDWIISRIPDNFKDITKEQLDILSNRNYSFPTSLESELHYPFFADSMKEIYKYRTLGYPIELNTDKLSMPTLGTAELNTINAHADSNLNLIVFSRSLPFFVGRISTIIAELATVKQNNEYLIKPSVLTKEYLLEKIRADILLRKSFLEIMCSYLITRDCLVKPKYKNSTFEISEWASKISKIVMLFITAHEYTHLVFGDTESTFETEERADFFGTMLSAIAINKSEELESRDFYWAIGVSAKILDILQKADYYMLGKDNCSHPSNRCSMVKSTLSKMECGGFTSAMIDASHLMLEILWVAHKENIKALLEMYSDNTLSLFDDVSRFIWDFPFR